MSRAAGPVRLLRRLAAAEAENAASLRRLAGSLGGGHLKGTTPVLASDKWTGLLCDQLELGAAGLWSATRIAWELPRYAIANDLSGWSGIRFYLRVERSKWERALEE